MKKKVKEKKKKKYKIYRLNFHARQGGMLEQYTPYTIQLVNYYINQIKYQFTRAPKRVKIYIEDSMGCTKEQIIPLLIGMPPNVKFIWGKRKKEIK